MAQVRVDDLDGKSRVNGDATVLTLSGGDRFADQTVTIDLSDKHVDELRALLAIYFENGVVTTPKVRTPKSDNTSTDDADVNAEIREWAHQNGHTVKDRGRLPKTVVEAYNDAHSASLAALEAAANPAA